MDKTSATHIDPMSLAERRAFAPARGMSSIQPASRWEDALITGNGTLKAQVFGHPLQEMITFWHERVFVPKWKEPPQAPKIADIIPEVRHLILTGEYQKAALLTIETILERDEFYRERLTLPAGLSFEQLDAKRIPPVPVSIRSSHGHPCYAMRIEQPEAGDIKNYVRTLDFHSGEATVHWEDERGAWQRSLFVSRPAMAVIQRLTPPPGRSLGVRIRLDDQMPRRPAELRFKRDFDTHHLIVTGQYDPAFGNKGYASVTRVVLPDGSAEIAADNTLLIRDASSALLITRIGWYNDLQQSDVDALVEQVDQIVADYDQLLQEHTAIHGEIFDRVSLDVGGGEAHAQSTEELLTEELLHPTIHPALMEKIFDMGRYFMLVECGELPPIWGHVNINVNLQIASGNLGDLPEAMESFFGWIEGYFDDFRANARNVLGCRGIQINVHPDMESGRQYHFSYVWPHEYWTACSGWVYQPFYEHYLVTGDQDFLRNRLIPGLKEIALFYEDFLTETDANGNYIFVPSYSPENCPRNLRTSAVVNSTMDIAVCKEVLTNLCKFCEELGIEAENLPKWKAMLAKLPPYALDEQGTLREWAWPGLEERYDHRHLSHLYGVWPGDEINPDETPELARAAMLANRKRAQENASAHGVMHRALIAARLKDGYLVYHNLKQILDQGYVNLSLMTNHNPYSGYFPDALGSLPALMMEMLVYSRPGVVELLPALPAEFPKGTISGVRCRTWARLDKLTWDVGEKRVEATLSSLKDQELDLIVRRGIAQIAAPEGVVLGALPEQRPGYKIKLLAGKPVTLSIELAE